MTRTLTVRKPTRREMQELERLLESELSSQARRRAETILYLGLGLNGRQLAEALHVHPNTVYADLRAFALEGLACVRPLASGRHPPADFGSAIERDLALGGMLAARPGFVRSALDVDELSGVSRQAPARAQTHQPGAFAPRAQKKDIRFRRVARKLITTDPQRPAILARIRRVFQQLPANGVMVFFAVKPVTGKAYGGRRWSSTRLVLRKYQKTRGRFYLFALYDVKRGRVRWRYYQGKDSVQVCRFRRCVRRWYSKSEVWVVLDQESAHPRKSHETRRVMCDLGLRWISLPKASPDDNPCETLLSDIQSNVQDNSDDPDERAMQKHISHRFTRRNRRQDRFIEIPYLWDSHKG